MKTYRYNRERGELYLIRDSFDDWNPAHAGKSWDCSHLLLGGVPWKLEPDLDFPQAPSYDFNFWKDRL